MIQNQRYAQIREFECKQRFSIEKQVATSRTAAIIPPCGKEQCPKGDALYPV